jgi:HPt (histidine-containing phosphotransfer) domain-containing protein
MSNMARHKDDAPSVATYADHEVVTPPHKLRKLISAAGDASDDPVARAEAALKQLSSEFGTWMESECERLDAARHDVKRQGFTAKTQDALFRAAHDIKGEAPTFGYPAVASVADSLCRLIEHAPQATHIPIVLVEQHVDAVRAIFREYSRTDHAEIAQALVQRLRDVTDDFLKQANSFRPDYLASIFAPPLAPGAARGGL